MTPVVPKMQMTPVVPVVQMTPMMRGRAVPAGPSA